MFGWEMMPSTSMKPDAALLRPEKSTA